MTWLIAIVGGLLLAVVALDWLLNIFEALLLAAELARRISRWALNRARRALPKLSPPKRKRNRKRLRPGSR